MLITECSGDKKNVGAGIGAAPTWGYCVCCYLNRRKLHKKVSIFLLKFTLLNKKAPQLRGAEKKTRREEIERLQHLGDQSAHVHSCLMKSVLGFGFRDPK